MLALGLALASTTATVMFLSGWRALRSDALEGIDARELVVATAHRRHNHDGPLIRMAGRLVPRTRRLIGPVWTARLQRQIDLAGRPDDVTVDALLRRFLLWAIIVSPAGLIFLLTLNIMGLGLTILVVGIMPLARLARARRIRQERIERDLPDFLDILAVTVTAGAGLEWALERVSQWYEGPLAQEVRVTLDQLAHGASRRQAFEALRQRNSSDAISQFVTAFLQSQELGAPLVETLNQIAADMRRDSAQRMRRRAARAAPRVTLVTSMVLVPGALVLVLVGLILGSDIDLGALLRGLGG